MWGQKIFFSLQERPGYLRVQLGKEKLTDNLAAPIFGETPGTHVFFRRPVWNFSLQTVKKRDSLWLVERIQLYRNRRPGERKK